MTDKNTLLTALADATHAYDESVRRERAAARDYAADLKAVAEAGELRRQRTAQARDNAYKAYRLARDNYAAARTEA